MKTRRLSLIALPALLLFGCASVQETGNVSQPLNTRLTAGVGDTVLRIATEKDLPNAFGRADIFGRKTPTGMTTVQYLGLRDGKALFSRHSQFIETGATTMNSTPLVIPNSATTRTHGNIGGIPYSGTSTTHLPPSVIPAHPPQAQTMDDGSLLIAVDVKKDKQLIVGGKTITIESADAAKLVYSISG